MIIKSRHKLKDFMQTLSNGHEVFDFDKIMNTKFPMILIMSERGSKGKTLNVKEWMRKEYERKGRPFIWLGNSVPVVEKVGTDYKKDFAKPFVKKELGAKAISFWDNTRSKGDIEKNKGEIVHTTYSKVKNQDKEETIAKDHPFIKLLNMNHTELMKGAREHWRAIVYDEFNVQFQVIRDPRNKFDSLLHSTEDVVANSGKEQDLQVLIFGNNKSLNNPLIYNYGVTHVEHEISEVLTDSGYPLMLIISPKFDEEQINEIDDLNKNNWIYQASKQSGTHKHSYFNESLFDELNNIVRMTDSKESSNLLFPVFSVYHKKRYYNIYRIRSGVYKGYTHVIEVRKKDTIPNVLFTFQKYDVIENSTHTRKEIKQLRRFIESDNITFEDVSSRELFISSIK